MVLCTRQWAVEPHILIISVIAVPMLFILVHCTLPLAHRTHPQSLTQCTALPSTAPPWSAYSQWARGPQLYPRGATVFFTTTQTRTHIQSLYMGVPLISNQLVSNWQRFGGLRCLITSTLYLLGCESRGEKRALQCELNCFYDKNLIIAVADGAFTFFEY